MRLLLRALALVAAWLVVAVPTALFAFTHGSAETVVASHDAEVRPTLDGRVHLDLGPYLPDLRFPVGGRVGIDVEVGKTTASTTTELAQRYAAIAARPQAEERRVGEVVAGLAWRAAATGAGVGLVAPVLWWLVGPARRHELVQRVRGGARTRRGVLTGVVAVAVVVGGVLVVVRPGERAPDRVQDPTWLPLQAAYPDVPVPPELGDWQVQGGLFTQGTRRLLASALDTFDKSTVFYDDLVDRVPEVAEQLRTPAEDETVAVLVSDRHDNIGMDQVVRAVADAAGVTVVLDAGDDTSTGQTWEAFSLDSLDAAFEGYDARVAIAGNHDNGSFVGRYLADLGWTRLEGEPVEEFGGVRVTGVDDPRSSGLGSWRDETGLSFREVEESIADDVCALDADDQRIATLLVHDANLGRTALARGCTDLVLAGHLHVQVGPDRVVGENGRAGYTYTNGTTGGAAYALAIGSKLRRDAQFTMVTYRDGRPVGIQPVGVRTDGRMQAEEYVELDLG
ncbi:metallophosphoesterase family protein [Nocardioides aurantiacus]|uniref:metallophosphoesterase family protein n=1 Tax=Nocardioides aurantiacus TaxID=86796 RepID=UPI00403F80C3